jgi:Mg-chelatase subunit ChlD
MSLASWSADTAQLSLAIGPGLVEGYLVAVSTADTAEQSAGVFAVGLHPAPDQRAVRIVPVPQLPARTVVVSEMLADDLGLHADAPRWQLSKEPAAEAATVVLESMTEGKLDDLVGLLARASDLAGQVLWLTDDGETAWVHARGTPFRVRSASGPGDTPLQHLVQISQSTEIQLVAPVNRTGVDIVILADCSGSMSWGDIEQRGASQPNWRGTSFVKRIDALKQALGQMIDIRAHTAGRVSRIALVSFTDRAECVFPRQGGMTEISGADDARALADFRDAVNILRPQEAGTDIGQALHFASELLYRQGVPGNDRLIVLVSDGAEWAPQTEEATGEAVAAVSDPVSLMEELEKSMGIKLHAIGISDDHSFHRWWDAYMRSAKGDPHVSIVPNHRLLTELVRVGGGDPRRVGGMEVLQEYFTGLGEGVTRRVGRPAPPALRPAQTTFKTLAEPRPDEDGELASRRKALADQAQQLRPDCVKLSERCGAKAMYQKIDDTSKLLRIGRSIQGEDEFRTWVNDLDHMFYEKLESRLLAQKPDKDYDIPQVRTLIWDGRMYQIRLLRNYADHESLKSEDQIAIARIMMRFADTKLINRDDARRWTKVQVGLLEDLVSVLTEVRRTLDSLPLPAQPEGVTPTPLVDGWR